MSISICIPTYNQGAYIAKAIRSAAQQAISPIEIIVSDDCSTDNTREVLAELQAEIAVLKVIYQPVNLGISKNVDACLKEAKGDFIIRLDSDDVLLPGYSQKLLALLEQYPEAGYAHAAIQEIDKNDQFLKQRYLFRKDIFQSADDALKAAVKGYRVAANILMFRRTALQDAGYIRSGLNFAEDYFLVVDIAAKGWGNVYCNDILARYRVWNDAGKVRQKRKLAEVNGLTYLYANALQPAFDKKQWSVKSLEAARDSHAALHADSLTWDVYTKDEKQELRTAILQLSSGPRTKRMIWLYEHGFTPFVHLYRSLSGTAKQLIKKIVLKIK